MSSQDTFTALVTGFAILDGVHGLFVDWSDAFWMHCVAAALNGAIAIWGLKLLGVFA